MSFQVSPQVLARHVEGMPPERRAAAKSDEGEAERESLVASIAQLASLAKRLESGAKSH
jgi:hypothetical protein